MQIVWPQTEAYQTAEVIMGKKREDVFDVNRVSRAPGLYHAYLKMGHNMKDCNQQALNCKDCNTKNHHVGVVYFAPKWKSKSSGIGHVVHQDLGVYLDLMRVREVLRNLTKERSILKILKE